MEDTFKFKKSYTDDVICEQIGRLSLRGGNIVRMIFDPQGFRLLISQDAIDSGSVIVMPKDESQLSAMEIK